ncbi:hypothetical protein [Pasteurella multocida]|uniref:hypothetical protein n=1 Tax=Pasteurella multocida TaxID=747 RepID=UPI00064CC70C|nr:hypothetical protein [Pasteurella multocida]KLT48582.1 hypothetical protein PVACC_02315 [Pasteurella multocida subsp. multocida]KLT52898.1 hypothetical protein PMMV1_02315 [Pasteurella multocida subsp. multocida]KLT58261.1 hypothetical protein ISLM_02315 [Pasteurella multocida subsp. multocida]KLT62901.1 hypothetical protein PESH_02315 [Pasteurella multocida subsp. multocida]KLU28279.1 hypothetical protein ATTK_10965 [Pasteurella multocida subsp. multocida]
MGERPELIVCAACELEDYTTKELHLVTGARHYDAFMRKQIRSIENGTQYPLIGKKQGFITNFGRFVDRKQALEIAKKNDQIKFDIGYPPEELYSEMLY